MSVRVPKSKRKEYRNAIKHFVEKKFIKNSITKEKKEIVNPVDANPDSFDKFEEFVDVILKDIDKEKKD